MSTPYEIRAELLNRAIDAVQTQCDAAFQTAIISYNAVANTIKDVWDLQAPVFQEAQKALEEANKKYENIVDDALKLAVKMNEFVSSKS